MCCKIPPQGFDPIRGNRYNSSLPYYQPDPLLIQAQLNHENLVKLKDVVREIPPGRSSDGRCVIAITEALSGGDLHKLACDSGGLSEDTARFYFRQILQGVAYLHARQLAHRRISLDKMLLSEDKRTLKLAGLRSVRPAQEDRVAEQFVHRRYLPPEALYPEKASYTLESDIWSCGVCLYCMTEVRFPFNDDTSSHLFRDMADANYQLNSERSSEYAAFLRRLLCFEPAQRYTAAEALKDPWVLGTDWTTAYAEGISEAMDSSPVTFYPDVDAGSMWWDAYRGSYDFALWQKCVRAHVSGESFVVPVPEPECEEDTSDDAF